MEIDEKKVLYEIINLEYKKVKIVDYELQ